ncbi:MAG: amidase, partial [Pseudomonadota bacterium]
FADEARAQAKALENETPRGPLHGLPVAFKDFTPTKGHITTRGSHAFADWVAPEDPVIVRRFKAAGAIIVGKTNTPEFATSSFTHPPLFGRTNNPWNPAHSPGGSSGGAGVAATTGCAALAEGTDMGGSVRIPASLCGCVGLKPSLGRIPMDILPTVYDDMSHFGPLTRTVDDAALFLRVAEGPAETDIMSQPAPVPLPEAFDRNLAGLRVAVSADLGFYVIDDEVRAHLERSVEALRDAGAEVVPVDLPWTPELVDSWYDWWGVYQAAAFGHLLDEWRDQMNPDTVTLIENGLAMEAVSFARIDQVRTRMWHDLVALFQDHHALLCPTMALPAPLNNMSDADFEQIEDGFLRGLDMTCIFNMVGHCPALSVPMGMTNAGLPTGAQIIAPRFQDPMALRIGAALEERLPWRSWTPEVLS